MHYHRSCRVHTNCSCPEKKPKEPSAFAPHCCTPTVCHRSDPAHHIDIKILRWPMPRALLPGSMPQTASDRLLHRRRVGLHGECCPVRSQVVPWLLLCRNFDYFKNDSVSVIPPSSLRNPPARPRCALFTAFRTRGSVSQEGWDPVQYTNRSCAAISFCR